MKIIKNKWMLLIVIPFILWLIGYIVKILHLTIGEVQKWPLHYTGIMGVLGTTVTGLGHLFLVSCGLFIAGLVIVAILLLAFESEGT